MGLARGGKSGMTRSGCLETSSTILSDSLTDEMHAGRGRAERRDCARADGGRTGFTEEEIESAKHARSADKMIIVASLVEEGDSLCVREPPPISLGHLQPSLQQALSAACRSTRPSQYALDERKESARAPSIMAIISPYNTYKNPGLPAGPIANPGLNSIEAALYPAGDRLLFLCPGRRTVCTTSPTTYQEHRGLRGSTGGWRENGQ